VTDYCHLDGRVVPLSEAAVGVRDRGVRFGDAAVERLRVYGGEPFEWAAHLRSLEGSLARLGFPEVLPPDDDVRDRVAETLDANDLTEALVEVTVTRGTQAGDLRPEPRVDPTVLVTADPLPRGGVGGDRAWAGPATLATVETRRPPAAALPADATTHNRLPEVLARRETDADEALLRTVGGHVTDGADSSLFLVHDGTLYTPSTDLPVRPRVTRRVVLDVARGESFPVETGRYNAVDVREADELFLASPTWEVRPVAAVDGHEKPVGPITRLCQQLFDRRVEAAHY